MGDWLIEQLLSDPTVTPLDLESLERKTVALESEEGTEYLLGEDGGILFVPRE